MVSPKRAGESRTPSQRQEFLGQTLALGRSLSWQRGPSPAPGAVPSSLSYRRRRELLRPLRSSPAHCSPIGRLSPSGEQRHQDRRHQPADGSRGGGRRPRAAGGRRGPTVSCGPPGQRSEVRGQRPEVEVRHQKLEIRGQRSEVRDQTSEVRGQTSGDGSLGRCGQKGRVGSDSF